VTALPAPPARTSGGHPLKGDTKDLGFSTRAIHAGQPPDAATGAVAMPIYQTSTYIQPALGETTGYDYARVKNPTRSALEINVAELEGGRAGHAFASGMAAISALLTFVKGGEHLVASRNVYGGVYRLLSQVLNRYDLRVSWVDSTNPDNIRAAMTDKTRLVHIESPTNPMIEVTDLAAAAEIAHEHHALLSVDNTFMSPYFQRPIELGADIVVHSTTKFLNGHSDSIGGVAITTREEDSDWFAFVQKSAGAILSPFDSFLVLRGIKTLAVRMDRHETTGRAAAAFLDGHPKVKEVHYPGLASHAGHEIQKTQASGFGALISFDLGSYEAAKRFLDRLQVLSLGESLGGVETLISHPATMTHASVPTTRQAELGITQGLVRVSIGLEDEADLLADLDQALSAV
jgi:cystathionine gamma-lyase/cystathionine beta-lyase/cystathionine gamma-lyase/homocysteine desulfhydrase